MIDHDTTYYWSGAYSQQNCVSSWLLRKRACAHSPTHGSVAGARSPTHGSVAGAWGLTRTSIVGTHDPTHMSNRCLCMPQNYPLFPPPHLQKDGELCARVLKIKLSIMSDSKEQCYFLTERGSVV